MSNRSEGQRSLATTLFLLPMESIALERPRILELKNSKNLQLVAASVFNVDEAFVKLLATGAVNGEGGFRG